MSRLLEVVDFDLVPFFSIGAFAGLRHWEMLRLTWADINLEEGHILVAAEKAKTAQRRIVAIQSNLALWLAPYRQLSSRICACGYMSNVLRGDYGNRNRFRPKNGLRHSYGSYRLAQTKNAAQVSLEMGNSPRMVFQHYREVVTDKQAQQWFRIVPRRAGNIVSIAERASSKTEIVASPLAPVAELSLHRLIIVGLCTTPLMTTTGCSTKPRRQNSFTFPHARWTATCVSAAFPFTNSGRGRNAVVRFKQADLEAILTTYRVEAVSR